jgi:hypothetical protein
MGHSTSAKLKVKNMGASQTFVFDSNDITQCVIVNKGTPEVTIRDTDSNDFTIAQNGKLSLSGINLLNVSGVTVITASGGSCSIIYH